MQSHIRDCIMTRQQSPIPEPIAQLQQQLTQWRSTNQPRTRLPEAFWNARSRTGAAVRNLPDGALVAAGLCGPERAAPRIARAATEAARAAGRVGVKPRCKPI